VHETIGRRVNKRERNELPFILLYKKSEPIRLALFESFCFLTLSNSIFTMLSTDCALVLSLCDPAVYSCSQGLGTAVGYEYLL